MNYLKKVTIVILITSTLSCGNEVKTSIESSPSKEVDIEQDNMQWWRDGRFGMFIHWGLYAQCEGYWNGKPVPGLGEWIFRISEIPVKDYHELTKTFTAENLDVESWIKLAKDAGMKYVVITAKHHDGFALFKSNVDSFNVVDATPYGKDVIRQFVDACNKYGLKIGFYYSQFQDWSYPGAGGNNWEPGYEYTEEGFVKYMKKKALPQVREILTNYGKIDMIWYDTPRVMTKKQSETFLNIARELQPDIIVSGRVGNDLGDYVQMEDNNLPKRRQDFDWEVPVTMNHTWAYKRDDDHWKSTKYLLWQLTYSTSMNGNYLLNIGPKADGTVPAASVERLEQIRDWMKVYGEAVTNAQPSPFKNEFEWGSMTQNEDKLFLNIVDWPENQKIPIYGLKNKVLKSYFLKDKQAVKFSRNGDYLELHVPELAVDPYVSVIVLEIDGAPEVDDELVQKKDGRIILETELAKNTTGCKPHFGSLRAFSKPGGSLKWNFKVIQPGTYKVEVITTGFKNMATPEKPAIWDGGHEITIISGDQKISGTINIDRIEVAPRDLYNNFKISEIGVINFNNAGMNSLEFRAVKINFEKHAGLTVRMLRLLPVTD